MASINADPSPWGIPDSPDDNLPAPLHLVEPEPAEQSAADAVAQTAAVPGWVRWALNSEGTPQDSGLPNKFGPEAMGNLKKHGGAVKPLSSET